MTFSRQDSAFLAYRQYLEAGYEAKEPLKDGNLWVVFYRAKVEDKKARNKDEYAEKMLKKRVKE